MSRPLLALILGGLSMPALVADEGMWLPTDPPAALLKAKYGFDLTDDFRTTAMLASVRFPGASGGFVSPDGLVVTNHHVGSDAIQKLSTADRDLMRDGFTAKTRGDELKCADTELNVLQSIEDVTARVKKAVADAKTPADAAAARRVVMSAIEKESFTKTGLKSEVVTLYQGGLYHLYRSKKYTDVRLVFCPEAAIAAFGGDVDNFEYPRTSLDVAFFRAYENDKPAQVKHYFKWSPVGPADGDLVLVTGHPGTTNRLETLAKLEHRRDVTLPYDLARLRVLEAAMIQYSERSPEKRREAANVLHGVANRRKAYAGQLQGLLDPAVMTQKAASEAEIAGPPKPGSPWAQVAAAQKTLTEFEEEYALLERGDAFSSDLFPVARHLVRLADEVPKPNADRLKEYRDSNLDSLKLQLYAPAPVYPPLEIARLQTALTFLAERLGGAHPLVVMALGGKNPGDRAADLATGTKLADITERKRLVEGGKAAIEASKDPLILLARAVDAEARRLRKRHEEQVEEVERQAYAGIADLRFQKLGKAVPPDATFTLRLAFGVVKGYTVDGEKLPFETTFGDCFHRWEALGKADPFALPPSWVKHRGDVDPATPFDFVSTADTIGGNSGSPVLNRAGELVGINFDRNRHGLVRNFVYTEVQARHVAVHCRAVIEALTKIYDAKPLADELLNRETR
jgi:hypothetical protein